MPTEGHALANFPEYASPLHECCVHYAPTVVRLLQRVRELEERLARQAERVSDGVEIGPRIEADS